MKLFSTILVTVAIPIAALAQNFQNTDNELHAPKYYKQNNRVLFQDYMDNPLYVNNNISQNSAPQNEPSVRISRVNPDFVVAAWRDFRLGYLGSNIVRSIGYSYSHDGGVTWAESQLLPDPNPDHISQSDPVVVCDMDGNFYISSTSRQPVTYYNREMLLYKSTDDGQTFQLHDIAVPGSGIQGEDKEWLFCDPVEGNDTYNQLMMVWRSFGPTYGIRFRKSEVGGGNWSSTKIVSDNNSGQGANITTGVDGEIIVVWKDNGIFMDRSLDGGETFGEDVEVSNYNWDSNNSFPFLCTDYSEKDTRGNIYLVWSDNRQDADDVWFQRSTDGGESWMDYPVRVNDVTNYDQFWPVVQCDTNGVVYVLYYDDRDFPGLYNAWLATSNNAGETWTNTRISDMTFYFNSPNSDVRFGDYIQVDAYAGKVIPVWTDDRSGDDNQEIYTALIDISISIKEPPAHHDIVQIRQNYPNPFHETTTLSFNRLENGFTRIEILNSLGQTVEVVHDGELSQGTHEFQWHNTHGAGIYYFVITTDKEHITRRMLSF